MNVKKYIAPLAFATGLLTAGIAEKCVPSENDKPKVHTVNIISVDELKEETPAYLESYQYEDSINGEYLKELKTKAALRGYTSPELQDSIDYAEYDKKMSSDNYKYWDRLNKAFNNKNQLPKDEQKHIDAIIEDGQDQLSDYLDGKYNSDNIMQAKHYDLNSYKKNIRN